MIRKVFLLLGISVFVAAANALKRSAPQYAAKTGLAHAKPGILHRMPQQRHDKLVNTQATIALAYLSGAPKLSATTIPRFTTAVESSSGNAPPPLPAEELETLKALYHSLRGPNWHIKDGWMSSSDPCGSGSFGSNWFGVECATYESEPGVNFSSHVTSLELPHNNLVGILPPLRGLQHLLNLDFSNPTSTGDSTGWSNAVSGNLDALCGLGNISTAMFAYNNVTGTIPDCIQTLANATVLDLDFNSIQGTTPDELCRLQNLEELHLRGNHLKGTVPVCIGEELTALRVLDYTNVNADYSLGKQSLSGTLPRSLCNLGHLEQLYFEFTYGLNGSLPDCLGAKQPQLQSVGLKVNHFQSSLPTSFCQASTLKALYLGGNNLTGSVPNCLGSLSQLALLELDTNQFHGSIPVELCDASALQFLLLQENALTGTLPSCLGSLSQLTLLDLSVNQFQGPVPEELCQASALQYLTAHGNSLTGTLPSCLGSLNQLNGVDLDTNQLHGPISEELCKASALEYLTLFDNSLTGTVPSCLGNLSRLMQLDLNINHFHGSIPEALCEMRALERLLLQDNTFTGRIPSCLATSFPLLEAMFLHDNHLTGTLPSEWALPSLISIMLSNNPNLSGLLPPSLFLQQSASNVTESDKSLDVVLRAVVIEGTSIRGTLPTAMCSAPQLVTLAFSGNDLTGSLPNCVTSLQYLQTLRVSNNRLTGTLPEAIDNMTSLVALDLSTNQLQGRVPAGLGDISHNLDTMHLNLNRLSCDLPSSVLDWQVPSENASFNLLDGNLFGCGKEAFSEIIILTIQGAAGLRDANEEAFEAYSCGSSVYVLPAIIAAILVVPILFGIIYMYGRGRLALQWRIALGWMVNPTTLINELDHADRQIGVLAFGVVAAATVAGSVALILSMNVAKSAYECEYVAAPTLANKRESDVSMLSIGVGAAVSLGLVLSLALWWRRLVSKYDGSKNDYGGIVAEKNGPLNLLDEDAEAWDYDAERMAESLYQTPVSSYSEGIVRALKLMVLILAIMVLTIGPNIGYVFVVLSSVLTQEQKLASEMAITFVRTAIEMLLVPSVAQKAVNLLVLNGALTFVRFRLRMTIATALSVMTNIVLPVSIVLATDPRCLYYTIKPQPAVGTEVSVLECSSYVLSVDVCDKYTTFVETSTYTPSFAYDGEVCVSAILSVYGPVFLGCIILTSTLPAGVDIFIVPWLAPWCYRNAESSRVARMGLAFLEEMTSNALPALAKAGVLPPDFSLGAAKLDYLAQQVVEQAFMQVTVTLLVALTFGIAVPAVGGACALAAFVQFMHQRHLLGQIVGLGRLEQPAVVPNLMGCTDIPGSCAIIVVVTVVLVWVCGAVDYLEPVLIGFMVSVGLIVALVACGIAAWWQRSRRKASRRKERAQSIASSDTSRGMLMESLIAEDEITEDGESN